MRKLMNLTCLMFLVLSSIAQQANIETKWSDTYKLSGRLGKMPDLFHFGEKTILCESSEKRYMTGYVTSYTFKVLDKDLKVESSLSLNDVLPKNEVVLKMKKINEKIFILSKNQNKKNDTRKISLHSYDYKSNKIVTSKELGVIKNIKYYDYGQQEIIEIQNSTNFLVELSYRKQLSEGISKYYLFDENLDKIWESDGTEKDYNLVGNYTFMQDDGTLFILSKSRLESDKKNNIKVSDINYGFMVVDEEGEQWDYVRLETNNLPIYDIGIVMNEEGRIFGAGFYSVKTYGNGEGYFNFEFDPEELEFSSFNHYAFSDDFVLSKRREKEKEYIVSNKEFNGNKEFFKLDMNKLTLLSNGNIVLFGDEGPISSYERGGCRDIICLTFNQDLELVGEVKIDKEQIIMASSLFCYAGHSYFIVDDKVHFIFNDHIRNIGKLESSEVVNSPYRNKSSILSICTIEEGNSLKREQVYSFTDTKAMFHAKGTSKCVNNSIIILSKDGQTKFRVGRLDL